MIAHALWISEAFGWERSVRRALKNIQDKQDVYGTWYEVKFDNTGYLTGLILDSFELIKDDPMLTFSIPDYKKQPEKIAPDKNQSEIQKIVNHINIETLQNIFGSTKSKRTKKSISSNSGTLNKNSSKSKARKYQEWINCEDACLIFNNKRIIFHYQGIDMDLCLRHSGPVYEMIMELMQGECPRSVLLNNERLMISSKGKKRTLADILRRTNEHLNAKVASLSEKKGISGVPDNIKFVGYDKSNQIYRFYIRIEHE